LLIGGKKYAARKRHTDGTHRAADPAATITRARRAMGAIGITRLANLTGLDSLGVPVWSAIRPNGRSLSTSQGKGLTHDHARASALMESIETWHAEEVRPRRRATWAALRARAATVDLRQLPRNARVPTGAIDWLDGWDLLRGEPCWVPFESVTLDTVFARPPVFDVSSNGLASGNHLLEAIVHGVCEVIERDAEARWRATRGDRRLDLATVRDPGARALLDTLAAAHVHTTVWDLTSDVGVPVYGCAVVEDPREPSWRALGLYQGFGCHLDPDVALVRALTEAVQTRVTYIAGSRDDFFPADYERATDEELLTAIWDDLHRPPAELVDHRAAPRLATATFEDDLRLLVGALACSGARRVVAVDLTRADVGIPVVKCIVPGRARDVGRMG
jgi:ribosomal protein S12 methylthiotransferase accessory factor